MTSADRLRALRELLARASTHEPLSVVENLSGIYISNGARGTGRTVFREDADLYVAAINAFENLITVAEAVGRHAETHPFGIQNGCELCAALARLGSNDD